MYRKTFIATCLFLWVSTGFINAETVTYDFLDSKDVNAIAIVVDSMLEPNVGYASPVRGTVTVDNKAFKILSGTLSLPTTGITMSNSTMTKVLHSPEWLDGEKNPNVTFEYIRTLVQEQITESEYRLTVEGKMSIAGVTKTIKAPLTLTLLSGKLKDRNRGAEGDLALLRCNLQISRKAFNIKPSMPESIVGDMISLTINLAGAHPSK